METNKEVKDGPTVLFYVDSGKVSIRHGQMPIPEAIGLLKRIDEKWGVIFG